MIWAVLAAVGVPLWLCAIAILTLVMRNRALRRRPGNIACRVRRGDGARWIPGHALWVHDVLAFRGTPAAWKESLTWVVGATLRPAGEGDGKLRRLGDDPVVATLSLPAGGSLEVAARARDAELLLGLFADEVLTPARRLAATASAPSR